MILLLEQHSDIYSARVGPKRMDVVTTLLQREQISGLYRLAADAADATRCTRVTDDLKGVFG
jgi:hypothetical protein